MKTSLGNFFLHRSARKISYVNKSRKQAAGDVKLIRNAILETECSMKIMHTVAQVRALDARAVGVIRIDAVGVERFP